VQGSGFVTSDGGRFVPLGFNYDHITGDHGAGARLLEDYWDSQWAVVEQDFGEMRDLGATVVRIHLQVGRFMPSPELVDAHQLGQLVRLVDLAERNGLRLDITGLGAYRRSDVPAWYDTLSDEQARWAAQARFWGEVAGALSGRPGVLCFDLMNEPVVPSGRLTGAAWQGVDRGGLHFSQAITFDSAGRDRQQVALQWIDTMNAAVHLRDKERLTTVGLLPPTIQSGAYGSAFDPQRVAGHVGLVALHVYPQRAAVGQALELVSELNLKIPLVVEETFNLHCSIAELREFILGSRPAVAGWIGFYWGETPAELERRSDIAGALMLDWLRLFIELVPVLR